MTSFEAVSFSTEFPISQNCSVDGQRAFSRRYQGPGCRVLDGYAITFTNEAFIGDVMGALAHANNLQ